MKRLRKEKYERMQRLEDVAYELAMAEVLEEFNEEGEWEPRICGCDRIWLERMGVIW